MNKLLGYDDDGNWIGPTGVDREAWREEQLKRLALETKAVENKVAPQIKRSLSDGVEKVYIAGYSKNKYMIHGVANTATINSHGYALLPRGCELNLPVPVLWAHAKYGGPIGEVVFMERNEKGIYVRAAIFTHEAGQYVWKKIVLGEVSGLSCTGENCHLQAEAGGAQFYDKWCIKEISICEVPANPDCRFTIYSPLKGNSMNNDFAAPGQPPL